MVSYWIRIISLIKCIKSTHPDITQPRYSDNAGSLGMSDKSERYFNSLKCNVPDQGYYPDPTKSVVIVHLKKIEVGELFCQCNGFKVCIGAHYLIGYTRENKPKGDWIKKLTEK